MTDARSRGNRADTGAPPAPEAVWPADPGQVFVPGAPGDEEPARTDGRRLRRVPLNREAVVDALLDLYAGGNLRPSTDEIAERAGISPRSLFRYFEDADDLAGEAVARQQARVLPVLGVEAGPDAPFADRVGALVEQRLLLFATMGHAGVVSRLRAPFQPRLAESLAQGRNVPARPGADAVRPRALRDARRTLAEAALAAADVLTSFESYQLLTGDRGFAPDEVRAVLVATLTTLLTPGGIR